MAGSEMKSHQNSLTLATRRDKNHACNPQFECPGHGGVIGLKEEAHKRVDPPLLSKELINALLLPISDS
jgi:hypothetical protein